MRGGGTVMPPSPTCCGYKKNCNIVMTIKMCATCQTTTSWYTLDSFAYKQGRAWAVRVLGLPLFQRIFARKCYKAWNVSVFSCFRYLFHKSSEAQFTREGTWILIKKELALANVNADGMQSSIIIWLLALQFQLVCKTSTKVIDFVTKSITFSNSEKSNHSMQ